MILSYNWKLQRSAFLSSLSLPNPLLFYVMHFFRRRMQCVEDIGRELPALQWTVGDDSGTTSPVDGSRVLLGRDVELLQQRAQLTVGEMCIRDRYMGTSHNRWYVERIVLNYLRKSNIEDRLLKRMIMEMRIDGKKFCRAIDHLHLSLGRCV